MSDQTSSCCAPDGTCSSQREADIPKPADHFLTKLRVEKREKIVSTLESTQDLAEIKDSLSPELPKYFLKKHIPIWIDNKPRIAHNKVMIIDDTWVETGSFNFTYSAQKYNAENMLWIKDKALAKKYLKNWFYRKGKSVRRAPSLPHSLHNRS